MTDTTPSQGTDPELEWRGPGWRDTARLIAVFAVLIVLGLVLMAATHQPGCGGG